MNCPICGSEVWSGISYDKEGNERGLVGHICQIQADTKGEAMAEYMRRVDALRKGEM